MEANARCFTDRTEKIMTYPYDTSVTGLKITRQPG